MAENGINMLARLEEILDIYGSEQTRWPAGERPALVRFVKKDAQAARLFAEARALDDVLAAAPAGEPSAGLAGRIVAAAVADGAREARVVPITAAQPARCAKAGATMRASVFGPAAALLAACFTFGIYLGVVLQETSFANTFETAAFGSSTADVAESLFDNPDESGSEQGDLL